MLKHKILLKVGTCKVKRFKGTALTHTLYLDGKDNLCRQIFMGLPLVQVADIKTLEVLRCDPCPANVLYDEN